MKLGFIGLGNSTTFITAGLRRSANFADAVILGYDPLETQVEKARTALGITPCPDIPSLAEACDLIVISVKPHIVQTVLDTLKGHLSKDKILLSVAAARDIAFLEAGAGKEQPIVRLMPNINAQVGLSTNAFCCNAAVTAELHEMAEAFLNAFGLAIEIPETMFPQYTVITGAAPAFSFMFIDALAKAAVKCGMSRQQALVAVCNTLMGSAKTVMESGLHPVELTDRVCSPAGVTIEGVIELQKKGFEGAVESAVEASFNKNNKM